MKGFFSLSSLLRDLSLWENSYHGKDFSISTHFLRRNSSNQKIGGRKLRARFALYVRWKEREESEEMLEEVVTITIDGHQKAVKELQRLFAQSYGLDAME